MPRIVALEPEFVEFLPDELENGRLYVSMPYATAAHLCCCGCGSAVYTPISPTDWQLSYNGIGVSLYPSIGNWNFRCQSHYWIERGEIRWAPKWTSEQIAAGRARDWATKQHYFDSVDSAVSQAIRARQEPGVFRKFWNRLRDLLPRR